MAIKILGMIFRCGEKIDPLHDRWAADTSHTPSHASAAAYCAVSTILNAMIVGFQRNLNSASGRFFTPQISVLPISLFEILILQY